MQKPAMMQPPIDHLPIATSELSLIHRRLPGWRVCTDHSYNPDILH
jgi:hypothetical protein